MKAAIYNFLGKELTCSLASLDIEKIRTNPNLTSFSYTGKPTCLDAIKIVTKYFKTNKTVTRIDFSGTNIDNASALLIADMLKVNHTFDDVKLSNCQLTPAGALAIISALSVNKSIKKFSIKDNVIGHLAISKLAEILQRQSPITNLNLEYCSLDDSAFVVISLMLKVNHTMKYLELAGNNFTKFSDFANCLKYKRYFVAGVTFPDDLSLHTVTQSVKANNNIVSLNFNRDDKKLPSKYREGLKNALIANSDLATKRVIELEKEPEKVTLNDAQMRRYVILQLTSSPAVKVNMLKCVSLISCFGKGRFVRDDIAKPSLLDLPIDFVFEIFRHVVPLPEKELYIALRERLIPEPKIDNPKKHELDLQVVAKLLGQNLLVTER